MGTLRARRRYFSRHPFAFTDAAFGAVCNTPDPFPPLTTRLHIRFGMRFQGPAGATTHQWGQWGVAGTRSWGFSIHNPGTHHPRLAVYPLGTDASLIGPEAALGLLDVFPGLIYPVNLWLACEVNLDDGAGNRVFAYWAGRNGFGSMIPMGDPITEVGATSFFNSPAVFGTPGLVASRADRMYELEVRETADGPLIVAPNLTQLDMAGSGAAAAGGVWLGADGRTWTNGPFNALVRSPAPRPYVA